MTSPARAALALVALLAVLPLQWQTIATTPVGVIRPFHVGAAAMLVLAASAGVGRGLAATASTRRVIVAGTVLLTIPLVAGAALGGWPWVNVAQHAVYVVVALVAGGCGWVALRSPEGRRILMWAAPISLVVFSVLFYQSSRAAGVSIGSAISGALGGDPDALLFGLVRASFAGGEVDTLARSNFRHEIMGALLVALAFSLLAAKRSAVLAASTVGILAICVLSLSRSTLLALVLVLAVLALGALGRGSGAAAAAVVFGIPLAALALLTVAQGLPSLLYTRLFLATDSYEGRVAAWEGLPWQEVVERLAVGGEPLDSSTHTLLGDATLNGGLIAGVGALVLVGVAVATWGSLAQLCLRHGSPLIVGGLLGCSVFLARAFTAGGGLLHLVGWLGLIAGVVALVSAEPRSGVADCHDGDVARGRGERRAGAGRERGLSGGGEPADL